MLRPNEQTQVEEESLFSAVLRFFSPLTGQE